MNTIVKSVFVLATVTGLAVTASPVTRATSTTADSCVDGSIRRNIAVTLKSDKSVTVGTVNNKPLCDDVKLYFSSYILPENYNGERFKDNPTASPQTLFSSTSVVLKKGATERVPMTIKMPAACKDVQIDVYYGPEIETVTEKGHGAQFIWGKILDRAEPKCIVVTPKTPVTEPPVVTVPTPEKPAPEVKVVTLPAELPRTGSPISAMFATGGLLTAATYALAYLATKRR